MTAKTVRELGILGALVIMLGGVLYWNLSGTPATTPRASSNSSAPANGKTVKADAVVIDVKLDRLARTGDTYGAASRDPFRFRPKPSPVVRQAAPPPVVTLPPPPQAQKPQAERIESLIRYWGYSVSSTGRAVASLTYGAVNSSTAVQLVGVEGDIIEGRFRLQRIEPNAIEVIELNGNRRARIPRL